MNTDEGTAEKLETSTAQGLTGSTEKKLVGFEKSVDMRGHRVYICLRCGDTPPIAPPIRCGVEFSGGQPGAVK